MASAGSDSSESGGAAEMASGGATAVSSGGADAAGGQNVMVEQPRAIVIVSTNDAWWQEVDPIYGSGAANVTVTAQQELQDWYGLGGTFNEKGWQQLMTLSEEDRTRVLRLLFDDREGIGFHEGRIPIGASDYAMDRYSLNETANDTSMVNFSIDRDKDPDTGIIPYIKAAQTINPDLRFWASPWSPPTWMKHAETSSDQYGTFDSPFDAGTIRNEEVILNAHALYLARFVQAYAAEGIDIYAVHPQNEPGWAQHYPSCSWASGSGYLYNEYIKNNLVPTFEAEGITAEIWLGTLSNKDDDDALGQEVMNDPDAKALVKGVGLQWGMSERLASYVDRGLLVYQTEHQCGNYPWLSSQATSAMDANATNFLASGAPNNFAYAEESWQLLRDWILGGVNAYMAWNMVLDDKGFNLDEKRRWPQNALITVANGHYVVTPAYHIFRHIGQYVEPGARRVPISSSDAVAFRNPDGDIVAILHSTSGGQTGLSAGGRTVQFEMPANGWATVKLPAE